MQPEHEAGEGGARRQKVVVCLFLWLVTLGVFGQSLGHEFVNYDDPDYVRDNAHVQAGLTGESVAWALTTYHMSNWHPLTWLSHMVDCQLFGVKPGPHHFTNLMLHGANVTLLFLLLCTLTRSVWPSAIAAALFAVHPLNVEPVAWVSARKHLLSTAFWLLTIWAYVYHQKRPSVRRYLLALLLFALGLAAKAMLVTLPCVLLLLDYWPLGRHRSGATFRRLVYEKIPFFVLAAAASAVVFAGLSSNLPAPDSLVVADPIPLGTRLANVPVHYVAHLGKAMWPASLGLNYAHPGAWSLGAVVGSTGVLLGCTALAVRMARRAPYLLMGWLWFLGTLVPVIGLVQSGRNATADRYGYVPLLGLFIAIAWGAWELAVRWRRGRMVMTVMGSATISTLAICAWFQVGFWQSSEALFAHGVQVSPASPIARYHYGNELLEQKQLDEAAREYGEALRLDSGFHSAHTGLGIVRQRQGRLAEAELHYTAALQISLARGYVPLINLGGILASQGRYEGAEDLFRQALEYQPEDEARADWGLGIALMNLGRDSDALDHLLAAARKKKHQGVELYLSLSACLARLGRYEDSTRHCLEALEIDPRSVKAHHNLGILYSAQGKPEQAISQFRAALEIDADQEDTQYRLGRLFASQERFEEAIRHLSEALRIRPGFPEAQRTLRKVRALQRVRALIDRSKR